MKNNKKVVRKTAEAGKFTQVHHSILLDSRLSGTDFRILTLILSDADWFNLTRDSIIDRLKLNKKTVQASFVNLEKLGYIKRTPLAKGFYYTISEYGNLSSSQDVIEVKAEVTILEEKRKDELDLIKYFDVILSSLPIGHTDKELGVFMAYLADAVANDKLTSSSQMTFDNLSKISKKLFPTPLPAPIVTNNSTTKTKFITEICNEFAGGKAVTIANKAEITKKVIKYFEAYDGDITEKLVKARILSIKGAYTSTGHLDQRYQN